MEALQTLDPGLAERVTGTERDPFYDDKRVMAFYLYVMEEWKK